MSTILPVALQMYTVRDDAARDFHTALRHVREIGYEAVELAGTYNMGAQQLADALKELNLKVAGAHVGLEALESGLDEVLAYYTTLGAPYLVIPALPRERRADEAGYRDLAQVFNRIGSSVRGANMTLCYHNHDFEFARFGPANQYGYDILMQATDPALVQIELDTYWVKKAGEDPAAYMRNYAGRVPLVHLKDMTAGDNPTFAEVGEGTMDFRAIFDAAKEAGAVCYIVEQDITQRPALESARISFDNLVAMGMVPSQSATTLGSQAKDTNKMPQANNEGPGGRHRGTAPSGRRP